MSSIRDKAAERETEEKHAAQKQRLIAISNKVKNIAPDTPEYYNRIWLEENFSKIIEAIALIKIILTIKRS